MLFKERVKDTLLESISSILGYYKQRREDSYYTANNLYDDCRFLLATDPDNIDCHCNIINIAFADYILSHNYDTKEIISIMRIANNTAKEEHLSIVESFYNYNFLEKNKDRRFKIYNSDTIDIVKQCFSPLQNDNIIGIFSSNISAVLYYLHQYGLSLIKHNNNKHYNIFVYYVLDLFYYSLILDVSVWTVMSHNDVCEAFNKLTKLIDEGKNITKSEEVINNVKLVEIEIRDIRNTILNADIKSSTNNTDLTTFLIDKKFDELSAKIADKIFRINKCETEIINDYNINEHNITARGVSSVETLTTTQKNNKETFINLFSDKAFQHIADNLARCSDPKIIPIYSNILSLTQKRVYKNNLTINKLNALNKECPNFTEVIEYLKQNLIISKKSKINKPFKYMPMLLVGPPGVGKTHFAIELAKCIGSVFEFVSMNSVSANFILSGSDTTWNGAKMGKVASTLINNEVINPVILLDEIEKVSSTQHDPYSPLFSLLESTTADKFTDEFINVPMNTTNINWIMTANSIDGIPVPILSRLKIFHVKKLTPEEMKTITEKIFSNIIADEGVSFNKVIDDGILAYLKNKDTRELKNTLRLGIGKALLENRKKLQIKDVLSSTIENNKIGFC